MAAFGKKKKASEFPDVIPVSEAIRKGDIFTKLTCLIMGAGNLARKQIIQGLLFLTGELAYILYMVFYGAKALQNFVTLGTETQKKVFNEATQVYEYATGDNSQLCLLYGVVTFFVTIGFILLWRAAIRSYIAQKAQEAGKKPITFGQILKDLKDNRMYQLFLLFPFLGIILFTVMPLVFMILMAFTNYDQQHLPPNSLFTWVGFKNFASLFSNSMTVTFGYSFRKVLGWTLVWAVMATFTTFIGGILLAKAINSKTTKLPKMWRTLFIISIAVPQFVTLLLVRNFFADSGIVNTICSNIGITDMLKHAGLVGEHLTYIPFLTDPHWAKVMIILINIWVGVPYQMLIATGVLMNIPTDQIESAKIDGATNFQVFWKITMPYILFIQGPALITDFVKNINNFNVIYLLTQDVFVTQNQALANSHAKEVDLLVTWLFRLTNEYYDYKMASVIGIIVFIICAAFTLISFSRMISGDKEEEYQ